MQSPDPKVIIVFFVKTFFGCVYIIPLWFICVAIFQAVWTNGIGMLSEEMVILLLDGAGCIFLAILVAFSYYWSWLTYINFFYELRQDGLHIKSGILVKKHEIIPFQEIETVEIYINPFTARLLNLYSIKIKTRDLDNTEGLFKKNQIRFIPGLTPETARALRPELLKYAVTKKVKKTYFDPVNGNYR